MKKIKEEVDKYLNNKKSIDILKSYKLKLPSKYKDKSMADFQKAFNKGMKVKVVLKNKIDNYTKEKEDSFTGISMAVYNPPNPKSRSSKKSSEPIEKYNTMAIFEANMRGLRSYKEITGTGIIHFNNPHQLVDRLELLAGSIFAQLKVITKKQLNDLLKKYILNK